MPTETRLRVRNIQKLVSSLHMSREQATQLAEVLEEGWTGAAFLRGAFTRYARETFVTRETISFAPPRPTMEDVRKQPDLVANSDASNTEVFRRYTDLHRRWVARYGRVSEQRSNNLTRRSIAAMKVDWRNDYDKLTERFGHDGAAEVFRDAIRPWKYKWRGITVGRVQFGKLRKAFPSDAHPTRRANTPADLYRLFFLMRPIGVDFDDMYGKGMFGITSPCRRFAMGFHFHKYELVAYLYVRTTLAVRDPASTVNYKVCDTGTHQQDAARWFRMVSAALRRKWDVYPGNNLSI
ncbi:MAG: hypothetical protein ACHREM_06515 [Polyangiales bacterium]